MRGFRRLLSAKCALCSCMCVVILLFIIKILHSDRHWYKREAPCEYSSQHVANQSKLTDIINGVLTEKGVGYFLCYGSLFGALRLGKSLPWDPDVEFCLISFEQMYAKEEIYSWFEQNNVRVHYNYFEDLYEIKLGQVVAEIIFFEYNDDFTQLERKLLFGTTDRFPSELVSPPLKKLKFHEQQVPVPNGDVDIQKHFYPEDWWQQVKPLYCGERKKPVHGHDHHHHH